MARGDPAFQKLLQSALVAGAHPIEEDTVLQLRAWTRLTNPLIDVHVAILLPNGRISNNVFQWRVATIGSANTTTFDLTEGLLISVAVRTSSTAARGHLYMDASLAKSTLSGAVPFLALFSDYLSDMNTIGWPGGPHLASESGRGGPIVLSPANPAAGADLNYGIPNNFLLEIISIRFLFTADATVANRQVLLQITDGTTPIFSFATSYDSSASTTFIYYFSATGSTPTQKGDDKTETLPPNLLLPSTFEINTKINSLQAADQISAVRIFALLQLQT